MPTLLHFNGPPGIGKSTLARRWADDHPGTLCCDIDVLRTMVGGWRDDFVGTGELVRTTALAMIGTYLAGGQDVVLPQLIARESELARFEAAAIDAGATYVHVLLTDERSSAVARFHARGGDGPHLAAVRETVVRAGGDTALGETYDRLHSLAAATPRTVVLPTAAGAEEAAYDALVGAVGATS